MKLIKVSMDSFMTELVLRKFILSYMTELVQRTFILSYITEKVLRTSILSYMTEKVLAREERLVLCDILLTGSGGALLSVLWFESCTTGHQIFFM